jgi:hypothetical protein
MVFQIPPKKIFAKDTFGKRIRRNPVTIETDSESRPASTASARR